MNCSSFYPVDVVPLLLGTRTDANSLIANPTSPIAPMPKKQIFTDSQTSLLPGFVASFKVLAH
jgi:hypothetical protein